MTPPAAPFEIPPIITYAVPGFVLLACAGLYQAWRHLRAAAHPPIAQEVQP